MAADERLLFAPAYTGELPLAMYDVPDDVAAHITAFPALHEPTYSPELTPPPYDPSAPGWSFTSLEISADQMFEQYIDFNF